LRKTPGGADDDLWSPNVWRPATRQGALSSVSISGPYSATGPGDTPARRTIFVCHPDAPADEVACARKILASLARRAYRRPVNDADVEPLLSFYQSGRNKGTFDIGIEMALRRMLASPEFIFRF